MSKTLAQIERPLSFAAQRKITVRDLPLEVSGVGARCKVRDLWEISKSRLKVDLRTWKKTVVLSSNAAVWDASPLAPIPERTYALFS